MEITTDLVKELRDMTGVSVMHCKKALEEAGGDKDKALVILRKASGAAAAKKGDRTLGAGTIGSYLHSTKDVGAMVLLACETDFVAKNEEFVALARDLALQVAGTNPIYIRETDIPEEMKQKAREVILPEVKDKPADMQEKIMEGKLASYFGPQTLMSQEFIKNPEMTVKAMLDAAVQKFGERIEVEKMVRFSTRA